MTEIKILCGAGEERAREIANLFSGGNRVHVAAISGDPLALAETPQGAWLVCDNWEASLPEQLSEVFDTRIIRLAPESPAPEAAASIVAAIRQAQARAQATEEAWANRLGLKKAQTPPPVPDYARVQPQPETQVHGAFTQPAPTPQDPRRRASDLKPIQPESDEPPMPPTHLVWAVVMTVLCCLPAGVVAIVFASQVSSRYYAGNYEGARRSSELAEIWIIVSFVLGVLTSTLYMPMVIAGWL